MKKLLLCFLILVSSGSYAVDPIDFSTATPAEVRAYNLKRQQEYIQKTDNSFADLGKKINQVKASVNGPHIKQTLERSGVLSDGSKVNVKAVVTQPVDKAKVAKTLTERLKNAKDHAKNLGKASIPSFVGMAAFTALMEGIDYVMGEGGEIRRPVEINPNDEEYAKYVSPYMWKGTHSQYNGGYNYSLENACRNYLSFLLKESGGSSGDTYVGSYRDSCSYVSSKGTSWSTTLYRATNPNYNPSAVPAPTAVVTGPELETALKNALESNNPALAAAIAGAITAAYTYDKSEGQNDAANRPVIDAANDMSDALPKAFDNPVPASDPERPSGYAKITDGQKTVEAYVTPAPVGGTTDTTTTPNIDPVTGQPTGETSTSGGFQFPKFCDWAAVVCDWIEWTKEPPEEEDQLEVPVSEIDKQDIKKDLITVAASACPPDQRFDVSGLPFGISINKSYSMQPICNTLEPLKYVFQLMTFCLCAFMLLRI